MSKPKEPSEKPSSVDLSRLKESSVERSTADSSSAEFSKWNARRNFEQDQSSGQQKNSQSMQIETFEAMLAKGQDTDMLRYTLGNAYYKEKQYDKAATHLRAAVEMNPDYSTAWKLLGRVLSDAELLEDALVAFDSGLSAAKKNGDKQVEKEITVFRRRAAKKLDQPTND